MFKWQSHHSQEAEWCLRSHEASSFPEENPDGCSEAPMWLTSNHRLLQSKVWPVAKPPGIPFLHKPVSAPQWSGVDVYWQEAAPPAPLLRCWPPAMRRPNPHQKCQSSNCWSWLPQIKDEIGESLPIITCKPLFFLWVLLQENHAGQSQGSS